jgi:hypothetical protein
MFWIGRHDGIMPWMPDLVTTILILAALATVVGAIIWNLDRIRNDGADPLVNPAWTILASPSQRWFRKRSSNPDLPRSRDFTDSQSGDTTPDVNST